MSTCRSRGEGSASGRGNFDKARLHFDEGYASVLKRAIRTLWIVLHEMDLMWIPVHKNMEVSMSDITARCRA